MPLHDIPQKFSSMQSWHIANPHRHLQQNGVVLLQQLQLFSLALFRFCLYDDLTVAVIYSLRGSFIKRFLRCQKNKLLQKNCQVIMCYLKCLCFMMHRVFLSIVFSLYSSLYSSLHATAQFNGANPGNKRKFFHILPYYQENMEKHS
jgi:hypothetical protein